MRTHLHLLLLASLTACSDDKDTDVDDTDVGDTDVGDTETAETDAEDTETSDSDDLGPAKPTLGAQVDRVGRPGISPLLVRTFAGDVPTGRDAYNEAATPSGWSSSFQGELQTSLAIWDSLDTVCGNQVLAGAAGAARYQALASVLVDDRLYVDAGAESCGQLLAVELEAAGEASAGCGGRTLATDSTDALYSWMIVGASSGVGDGVELPAASDAFPYVPAPH